MLEYIDNSKDINFEVSEISEPIVAQLMFDLDIDEEKATDLFFSSKTFGKLADESTQFYKKAWKEVYELVKQELGAIKQIAH